MRRLEGKNAIITGSTSGIGQAIAVRLSEEGANVAINYVKDPSEAEGTEALVRHTCSAVVDNGCKELVVGADVSNEEQVIDMFSKVAKEWGQIDILVNNAGIQIPSATHESNVEDFDKVMAVNIRGSYLCAREAIKHFLDKDVKGSIINNSSVHEVIPKPKYIGYSASKGAMRNLTKTLALEYASNGIRVNAVGPGAIVTPINKVWINDPKAKQEVESHIPMGRSGDAKEIAAVVAFLASEDASYITGQTLFADGGLTLYPEFRIAWSSGE